MEPTELVEAVRSENNTELSRLGSSKSLYADTGGELEPTAVLSAMADTAHHAAETVAEWGDPFTGVAERERRHYDDIVAELDAHEPGDTPAVVAALTGLDDEPEQLGASLGYTLVAAEKASQATGFFTGQADPQTAGLFRGFGNDYETTRASLLDRLEEHDEAAVKRAETAATAVVGAAYEEYVDRLESMGINPKPVC